MIGIQCNNVKVGNIAQTDLTRQTDGAYRCFSACVTFVVWNTLNTKVQDFFFTLMCCISAALSFFHYM